MCLLIASVGRVVDAPVETTYSQASPFRRPWAQPKSCFLSIAVISPWYTFLLTYSTTSTITVGVDTDADAAALLLKELEGKDVEEVIAEGREKLSSVPAGGAVAVAGGAAAAAGGDAPAAEEKVEEEEDEDMGFSLFD